MHISTKCHSGIIAAQQHLEGRDDVRNVGLSFEREIKKKEEGWLHLDDTDGERSAKCSPHASHRISSPFSSFCTLW